MTLRAGICLTDLSERIRHRAIRSNDGGAVPIWELAREAVR